MIIRSLHLKNIRSYADEKLEFSEGTTLLSGDIGSGKTTILLAIEFAIFGIMKGVVAGSSLLRHGASSGFVELNFRVENKNITVRRFLKRVGSNIVQEPGVLITNGESFEGTPQELKSRILDLLGYPESLLNKSKSLIFRYTVFTPQEEMKRILYESREERLDILRRLFNIDKYKRIKDNTLNYARELKSQANFLEGKLESLGEKRKELEEHQKSKSVIVGELRLLENEFTAAAVAFEEEVDRLKTFELEYEQARDLERQFQVKKSEVSSLERQMERFNLEITRLKEEISQALSLLEGFDASVVEEIRAKGVAKQEELKKLEKNLSDIISKRSEFLAKKSSSKNILDKVVGLDTCPTCLQRVTPEHVEAVKSRENQLIHNYDINLQRLDVFHANFSERKKTVQEEIDNYIRGEREFEFKRAKFDALDEKKKRKEALEKEYEETRKAATAGKTLLVEFSKKIDALSNVKESLVLIKKKVEERRNEKAKLERLLFEKKSRADLIGKLSSQLESEISKLELEEERLHSMKGKKSWLEEDFIKIIDLVEKSVLARVHGEFNSFFQDWFNTLIEDETISVRLDDYFSPIVEQNGYETWIENLSGGEKTSVALAYRMALNKVVNDFLSSVKTRDLIILDEPTEGFSSDQLDRVREVLNQARVQQTIIVSHESKMEGFVDRVIRVQKHNHVSKFAIS